ncbi:hypothetical protein [Piscinibacter sp.]|jgi:hypothetical protein|uniref:hypothetical protein n=1 Tax=Piscinibacter sp. TaxID=1903157 RepID=UPI002F3FADF9
MNAVLPVVVMMLASCLSPAHAASVTIADQNSSLKFTIDEPTSNLGVPNDPIQLPRTVEWTVDGRRILVYPSGPLTFVDVGHIHPGLHVAANQLHAQGPMLGFGTGAMSGTVIGGVVYSVDGGAAGSGVSRISEKVDIHNKTGGAVSMSLAGMGYKPPQAALEVPDFTGLKVTGTTLIYFQGNAQTGSLTAPPFAPVTVRPIVSFSGFNPLLNQSFNLPAGAVLTMVTELKVENAPWLTVVWWVWLVVLLAATALVVRKRTRPPG